MKIDLICNVCGFKTKGDAEMIGQDCPKCDEGSFIDASAEDAEGSDPEKPKGTEKGGEKKITKEEYINTISANLIEHVQNEDMFEFKKEFQKVVKEKIIEKINEMKVDLMKEYSDAEDENLNEQVEVGSMGVLEDGSEFSVTALNEDTVTLLVGGKEMTMSMDEFSKRAKVNSKA